MFSIDCEEMVGIDHIFIDESHQFKNLTFNTRHDRVAGLRDSSLVDNMMLAMGYGKSLFTHMQLNGGVRYYTNGCDVDETGAMVAVRSEKANVVRISTKGQPQGSALSHARLLFRLVW